MASDLQLLWVRIRRCCEGFWRILDRTAERVGKGMTNQPAVEAELRSLIGRLYFEIGNYDQAEAMHRAALAINRKLFGPESKETAASLNDLGLALWKEGNFAEAESTHREALGIRRRLFENADVATSLNNLATVYRHQRRFPEAEALIQEALEIRQKVFGNESLEVADSLHNFSTDSFKLPLSFIAFPFIAIWFGPRFAMMA